MTYHFKRTICFQDLNDYEVEAEFSADADTNIVSLERVQLGGLALTSEQVLAVMGQAQFDAQVESVQDWYCDDGWRGIQGDYRAYWAEAAE